ncbi:hypothetical protein DL764_006042 [Monosporascus ibericus]|uniref:Phosphodiesterase n=1 Tax=Monosporascus ibericus TaxID=155417 RepID=A0A4Q4T664_9PEZI|nr:hypothetical protein DL764_006042 [Monosporascus ibericus]
MDSAQCNVIYVDRNAHHDRVYGPHADGVDAESELSESGELRHNLELLGNAFGADTPYDERVLESTLSSRDHSPHSRVSEDEELEGGSDEELYGLRLLERIVYETHLRNLSRLVVPIPVISFPLLQSPSATSESINEPTEPAHANYLSERTDPASGSLTNRALLRRCLDSGAIDVMASPLHVKTLTSLEVHSYRAHKKASKEQQSYLEIRRGRKRSWVGMHEEKPFSYLREAMVSGLMSGICQLGNESEVHIGSVRINVSSERRAEIAEAIGKWHFSAHDFCDDSLLVAANLMFKHALSMPELEQWRIPADQMTAFLVACRAAYNTFVPYHNFRHAIDVLQATFSFLVHIGALPPYPFDPNCNSFGHAIPKSPLAALLKPFEALTLLISAIGHDVGHPGVNNGFLIVLNAPLAQLYNDRSVLESFHCAAYSQILRRYWPRAFEDTKMRSLMISSILATDMGLHFDYMKKLGDLQEKLHENNTTDGWNGRMLEEMTALACALLIKCADISNVARKYEAALKWMHILCDEFSRQASMESEIGIPSSLISPPKKDFESLAKAQLGFMNMFAIPLFQGVADVLPPMQYTTDELEVNKALFEKQVEEIPGVCEDRRKRLTEGTISPRSVSLAVQSQDAVDCSSGKCSARSGEICEIPEHHAEMKRATSSAPGHAPHIPNMPGRYKEINGLPSALDSLASLAANDPFNINEPENRGHSGKQRSSETTEGSSSVPCTGDWQSQGTSATNGKMPLSPSTQGTSIISRESAEGQSCVPATMVTAPDPSSTPRRMAPPPEPATSEEDSNGSTLKPEKGLRKKTSRFRMNALNLFRRNKGTSPPGSRGDFGS